jgi:hypothetical protein
MDTLGMAGTVEGVRKTAAKRIGVTLDEYERRLSAGERWCFACKSWHLRSAFHVDRSRSDGLARACRESRNLGGRERYEPVPEDQRRTPGPVAQVPRDGDVLQARARVALLVRTGRMRSAAELPCFDCGHVGDDRRHEYDHYLGYGATHHEDVQPVCSVCHSRRGHDRGELRHAHDARGRFAPLA